MAPNGRPAFIHPSGFVTPFSVDKNIPYLKCGLRPSVNDQRELQEEYGVELAANGVAKVSINCCPSEGACPVEEVTHSDDPICVYVMTHAERMMLLAALQLVEWKPSSRSNVP